MKKDITIVAEPRASRGKNEARRLRVRGLSPAVVYGAEKDPVAVCVNPKDVTRILMSSTGHNTIFDLDITGVETTPAMIIDWQNDPIRERILHIDMKRIDLGKSMTVKVPVHTSGESKGVKLMGGLLEAVTREVEIECLPDEIPEFFNVDVTELAIGQGVRAGDIPLSGSMKLLSPADSVIVHVVALKHEEAAPAAEGAPVAAGAEPEVIKKGKKEAEGGADEKKKK